MNWRCRSCGSSADMRLEFCPLCETTGQYQPEVRPVNRAVTSDLLIVSGKTILARATGNRGLSGMWDRFMPEGIQTPGFYGISGGPGVGKTTAALHLCHDWPGNALFLSIESGMGASIQGLMAMHEVYDFDMSCPCSWDQVVDASKLNYDLFCIDSLQRIQMHPDVLRSQFVDRGRNIIVLSQVNSSGDPRGGIAAMHESDVWFDLISYGRAVCLKNRWGALHEFEWASVPEVQL